MKAFENKLSEITQVLETNIDTICETIGNQDHDFVPANLVRASDIDFTFNAATDRPIKWVGNSKLYDADGHCYSYECTSVLELSELLDALLEHLIKVNVKINSRAVKVMPDGAFISSLAIQIATEMNELIVGQPESFFDDLVQEIETELHLASR